MTNRTWSRLSMVAIAVALASPPTLAGKGNGNGKPGGGDGGGGEPPPAAQPEIVYGEYDGTVWRIKSSAADGSGAAVVLTVDASNGVTPPDPSWSPDLTEIVFKAFDSDGTALYVVAADGSNLRKIVPGDTFSSLLDPAWSPVPAPDGEYKIAFSASIDGSGRQVHVCNTDGSELVNVSDDSNRADTSPTWSPDATSIAAGTSTTTVYPLDVIVYDLQLSGATIARDGAGTIATAGTALSGERVMDLAWSPIDDVIALTAKDAQNGLQEDVWTLDLGDGSTENLTATTSNNERSPAWSPDGTQILFQFIGFKKDAKRSGLYVMNVDGSSRSSIGLADARDPDWR
jgi:Tol biopolymer transport system component